MSRLPVRPQLNVLTALAGLALVLAVTNGVLFASNRSTQDDINARQALVQQAAQLEGLQREIAKALADLAIKGHDRKVLDMLAANGVTVTMNAPAAGTNAGAGAPADATPAQP